MSENKTYLMPRILRRGSPTITAVAKDGGNCYLVTWYDLDRDRDPGHFRGEGRDYGSSHRTKISPELYEAFVTEARRNHGKYRT